ncbi:MAG: hypothetical protein GKR95_01890 [Gammaproteobacteria bacterium]|nr:hypothetical protein [Gammaproteobacteria bacterium]
MNTQGIIENYYQFLKERNREGLLMLLSPEIEIIYHANNSRLPWAGEYRGIEGFDKFLDTIKTHLDIVEVTVLDRIYGERKAVMQCQGTWKRKSTQGLIKGGMVNVFTIADQLITKYEVYADTAAFEAGMFESPMEV